MINIFGSKDFRDVQDRTLSQIDQREIFAALNAFASALNAGLRTVLDQLCDFTTEVKTSFGFNPGGEMQPISEYTHPEATTRTGEWDVAYDIAAYGYRNLFTQAYLDEANLEQLNRDTLDAAIADVANVRRQAMKLLMGDTNLGAGLAAVANYTYNDNKWPGRKMGNLTVRRLFNNDGASGELYVDGNAVSIGTLQAYKVSGAAAIDATAFTLAKSYLQSLGHDGDIVVALGKTTAETASGLASFTKTNDEKIVDPAKKYALVSSPRAIGRYGTWAEVQVWPQFPENYLFAFDRSRAKPLKLREHHLAKNRGFQLVVPEGSVIDPMQVLKNRIWRRMIGGGMYNRANGVAVQITTNGTYTAPTL